MSGLQTCICRFAHWTSGIHLYRRLDRLTYYLIFTQVAFFPEASWLGEIERLQ